jgi:hypothetical protein
MLSRYNAGQSKHYVSRDKTVDLKRRNIPVIQSKAKKSAGEMVKIAAIRVVFKQILTKNV